MIWSDVFKCLTNVFSDLPKCKALVSHNDAGDFKKKGTVEDPLLPMKVLIHKLKGYDSIKMKPPLKVNQSKHENFARRLSL